MASISSAGIGSGLDVNSIVTQLMAVERQPLAALQTKVRSLDSKISAFGALKSQLSTLSDAADKLSRPTTWNVKAITSSNSAAVSATASDGGTASATSFSVEVTQLARAQSVASAAVASDAGFRDGTLSIQLGTWSGDGSPTFTPGSSDATSVNVAGGDTVATIAAKINEADGGVVATVLRDLSGDRLLLRSKTTGEPTGFRIQGSDDTSDANASLSLLAFDNPAGGAGMAANPVQYAKNAAATVNGFAVTSTSNSLSDTVPGLSLTLSQVTTAPVEISATTDVTSMRGALDTFVSAYNGMNQMLNAATKYDAGTRTAALLQGDATTVGLQTALRRLVGSISGGGALGSLSDLGISIAKGGGGDLAVDSAQFSEALKAPDAVRQFFTASAGGVDAATGFATRFAAFTKTAIGSAGVLTGKTSSLQSRKTSIGKDQERLNDRLTSVEQRLRKQYTTLDTTIGSLNALNTFINQQVAQWNRSTS